MPVIDGKKYACESCVRGHRVSNCNHDDRELKLIPPKGRPVKQCEHCRTARKSKSHHAKCDCGSKKDKKAKDKAESPPSSSSDLSPERQPSPVSHHSGCSCDEDGICLCGSKPEPVEMRSARKPPQTVRSRPSLSTSNSETKLMVITNGHHAPCHRNNNLGHTAGAPYPTTSTRHKMKRPQSLHGPSGIAMIKTEGQSPNLQYASDDLDLDTLSSRDSFLDIATTSISEETVASPSYDNTWTFDAPHVSDPKNRASVDYANLGSSLGLSWQDLSPTVGESTFSSLHNLGTSPNFDYNSIPTHPGNTFHPDDLPLVSPQATSFSHTFSLDDFATVPGLTSNSSASDIWAEASTGDNTFTNAYWSDTIQVRNSSSSAGLDRWRVESGNDLGSSSIAGSSTALYMASKSSAVYDTLSASSYDVSHDVSQDDVWVGNMGTEPQSTSLETSTFLWPEHSPNFSL